MVDTIIDIFFIYSKIVDNITVVDEFLLSIL